MFDQLVGWLNGRLIEWSFDRMVRWPDTRMVGWPDGDVCPARDSACTPPGLRLLFDHSAMSRRRKRDPVCLSE